MIYVGRRGEYANWWGVSCCKLGGGIVVTRSEVWVALQLVGQSDDSGVLVHAGQKRAQPSAERRLALGKRRKSSPCAVDQQLAKIAIASLANSDEAGLAACGDLSGHKAKPRGKVSSTSKCPAIADCCRKSRRIQHADAGDGCQAPGSFIIFRTGCKFIIESGDASVEDPPFFSHVLDQLAQS